MFVSNNGAGNAGDLDFFSQLFGFVRTFTSGNNQGIALDQVGTAMHNGDASVNFISLLQGRTGSLDGELDRTITIAGATSIKGSGFSPLAGVLFLADFGGNQIYTVASSGDGTVFGMMAATAPWDVVTDEAGNRMFVALTDGSVGVLDNAREDFGDPFDRVFTAAGLDNAHGIAYDAASDTLVVSDVGDPGVADDGEIYVFANASTADGTVAPQAVIGGSNTLLGNPVDIDLANGDLRVAEKSQDQLLIFANILQSTGGNIAPSIAVAETKPESLASQAPVTPGPDNSDIDGGVTVQGLVVSTNNDSTDNGIIRLIPSNLNGASTTFDFGAVTDSESVKVDGRGDLYVTRDSVLSVFGRAGTTVRDDVPATLNFYERSGGSTSNSKGLDVVESRGLVMVANLGDNTVQVLGKESDFSTNVAVTDLTSADAAGNTWDLDYDPINDRLFVTKGASVLVYDNYLAGNPATATPDREIDVDNGVFLHGIVYDAANDVLLLSDVGSGMVANDGQLFVIENAATADGTVVADVRITNSATNMLGNPVDVAWDGANLYVAEKSNNLVVRFDNIRSATSGAIDFDDSRSVTAPESISLVTGL